MLLPRLYSRGGGRETGRGKGRREGTFCPARAKDLFIVITKVWAPGSPSCRVPLSAALRGLRETKFRKNKKMESENAPENGRLNKYRLRARARALLSLSFPYWQIFIRHRCRRREGKKSSQSKRRRRVA